jgi:hypothetical protein
MPTLEKEVQPTHAVDRQGFKRFMHEWEEKLHRHVDIDEDEQERPRQQEPEHKKAA